MKMANRIIAAIISAPMLIISIPAVYAAEEKAPVETYTEQSEVIKEFPATVQLWYEDILDSDIRSAAGAEADKYIETVDTEELTPTEIEKIYFTYFNAKNIELHKEAYAERSAAILSSLGIDADKAVCSGLAPLIICEITEEQYISALNNEVITSVSKHEPLEDTQDMTTMMEETSILPGDANCDYKLTVADAVAVLQYIANAEKYPLSPQGKVNADIDGVPGITGTDAIAIQCIDAGVEYVPKAQKKRTYSTKEELIRLMVSEDEDFSEHGFIYAAGYKFDAVLNAGNDSTKDYLIIYGLDPEDCKLNEYRCGYMPDDIVINYTDFIYAAEPEFYSGSTYMPGALKEEYRITSESGNSLEVIFLIDRTAPGFMYEMTDERWTASYGFSYMPYVFPEGTDSK